MTPARLAMELDISDKTLRGFPRRRFPRHVGELDCAWSLTAEQAEAARTHFGGAAQIPINLPPSRAVPIARQVERSSSVATTNNVNEQRQHAAGQFKPDHIRLLLVAQTPPVSQPPGPARYFYLDGISKHDHLFRGVVRAVLRCEPSRASKVAFLDRLREQGVFLIDLKSDPTDATPFSACVPDLVERCGQLKPNDIILIKSNVYDEAFDALKAARLPVIDARIPFPSSGRQTEFANEMANALKLAGWTLK